MKYIPQIIANFSCDLVQIPGPVGVMELISVCYTHGHGYRFSLSSVDLGRLPFYNDTSCLLLSKFVIVMRCKGKQVESVK